MELLFLGTSSGTPTKTRNVTALALRLPQSGHWCMVDCGEGTQHQLLHTGLSLASLRAIFITHIHGDHCYGLPGLLASAGMLNRTAPMFVAGPPAVGRYLRCVMETTELWLPYPVHFVPVDELERAAILPDFAVRATALSHRVPSFAYTFTEREVENKVDAARLRSDGVPAGPLWGQLQQGVDAHAPDGRLLRARDYLLAPRKPRKVIVGGDNDQPWLLARDAAGADVLVHEATYTEPVLAKMGPGPQHSSARMVAQFASEAGIRNLVLTHFSPRYQQQGALSMADIEAEARAAYRGNLFLASDFDRYMLDRQGALSRLRGQDQAAR